MTFPSVELALWTAGAFLLLGLLIGVFRKTLGNFSRKGLQEKLSRGQRDRFAAYLERLDEYGVSLRILDQGVRIGLVVSLVLAFTSPRSAGSAPLVGSLAFLFLLAAVLVTVLIGLELVAAIISKISPEGLMRRVLPLLDWVCRITASPVRVYTVVVAAGARALGSQPPRKPADVVEEEILSAVEEGEREGILKKSEISMIESIFEFRDRNVGEVLTPRTDMLALELATPIPECVRIASECGHSRIPVFRKDKDDIIGILYVKDLLRLWNEGGENAMSLEDLIRKAHFVPETKKVSVLLQEFKTQRFHIAIVLDEFGGTAGLITIEDIIEEILGEIEEETEGESPQERLVKLADDLFEIDARFPIDDINEALHEALPVPLPEGNGVDTLGGFLFSAMGKIPAVGESYEYGPLLFEILDADERMIRRIRLKVLSTSGK